METGFISVRFPDPVSYTHLDVYKRQVYRRDDIPLKELNLTFINNFEYFLRTEKKCRTNTVWGYMIGLKRCV